MQLGCCSWRVLIAFSVLFLYKGLYVWEYSPWSYLNIYSLAPCCLIALNMLLLGCCFQLLHFLVSVLCSCSSVILPHTNIATSVTERGLGSLSEDLAEVRHELQLSINKIQIVILSPCKYSLWSHILSPTLSFQGHEYIFKHLSIKPQNISLRYWKLGDKGINLPNTDIHLLQKLNGTSQLFNNAHLNPWMMDYSHKWGN